MNNFYFLCITQPTNLGDLVINKMLVDELCLYGRVYLDAYNTPDRFRSVLTENAAVIDLHKQRSITAKRFNLIRLFLLAKRENIHFFVSSPGPVEGGNALYGIAVTIIRLVFILAGAKNYCIGGCCSSMISSRKKFKKGVVDHFYMRSKASVDFINSSFSGSASYIPDMAYLLRLHISPVNSSLNESKKIFVNFRDLNDSSDGFFSWCKEIINSFCASDYSVLLYYQVENDFNFMNRLYQDTKENGVEFRESIVWYDDLNVYKDAGVVISNRLHSILIGAVYGAIPIACVSDHKLTSKIKDVLCSSLGEEGENVIVPYFTPVDRIVSKVREGDSHILENRVYDSAKQCREVIKNLVYNGE